MITPIHCALFWCCHLISQPFIFPAHEELSLTSVSLNLFSKFSPLTGQINIMNFETVSFPGMHFLCLFQFQMWSCDYHVRNSEICEVWERHDICKTRCRSCHGLGCFSATAAEDFVKIKKYSTQMYCKIFNQPCSAIRKASDCQWIPPSARQWSYAV